MRAVFQFQAPRRLIFGGAIYQRVFYVTGLRGLYMEGLIFGILQYFKSILNIYEYKSVRKIFFYRNIASHSYNT